MAARQWPESTRAPGDDVIRLRAVRVRTEAGDVADAADIRLPIGLEMEYDVLKPGHLLLPYFEVFNDEGVKLFTAIDQDPAWRRRPRPPGRYVSTAWIPGNLLSEGMLLVSPAMRTLEPMIRHFNEREAVAFQVIDSMDGNSVRGDFAGNLVGVIRPNLEWETQFIPNNSVPDIKFNRG